MTSTHSGFSRMIEARQPGKSVVQDAWRQWHSDVIWDVCVTLTFTYPKRDAITVEKMFVAWLNAWESATAFHRHVATPDRLYDKWLNAKKSRRASAKITWLGAIEGHASGDLHVHALIT